MKEYRADISVETLSETGLLWLINAQVMHPRGLILMVDGDGLAVLANDLNEPVMYADSMETLINQRYQAWNDFVAALRTPEYLVTEEPS